MYGFVLLFKSDLFPFTFIKDFKQCWCHLYIIAAIMGFTSVDIIIKTLPETSTSEYWGSLYS